MSQQATTSIPIKPPSAWFLEPIGARKKRNHKNKCNNTTTFSPTDAYSVLFSFNIHNGR